MKPDLQDYDEASLIELMAFKELYPEEAKSAFRVFHKKTVHAITAIARKFLTGKTDPAKEADDLAAETMTTVYEKAEKFDRNKFPDISVPRYKALAWAKGIMKNVFRKQYLRNAEKITEEHPQSEYIINTIIISEYHEAADPHTSDPIDPDVLSCNIQLIEDYLNSLPARNKSIIKDYYFWYESGKYIPRDVLPMIAATHGVSKDNIRQILSQFRKQIKNVLKTSIKIRD